MTIAAGFYQSAEGREAENAIALAALRAFRAHGVNKPTLAESIQIPGLTDGQVSGVVTALREQNLLQSSFVKRGYFSVNAYRLSEEGERVLHQADGISAVDADKEAVMKILRSAAKEDGPCLVDLPDIQDGRARRLIQNLKNEGMLQAASVKRGFFSMDGVQITDHGKASLAAYDSKVKPRPSDIQI